MGKRLQVYKCEKCGQMAEVMHDSGCDLNCCGQPMKTLVENTTDAAKEKHVPAIEKTADGFTVRVGSVVHPMENDHYIEWIELLADGASYKKYLKPGDKPEAHFQIKASAVSAREYCNKHGLWKAEA
jgi:superoxide reductase